MVEGLLQVERPPSGRGVERSGSSADMPAKSNADCPLAASEPKGPRLRQTQSTIRPLSTAPGRQRGTRSSSCSCAGVGGLDRRVLLVG